MSLKQLQGIFMTFLRQYQDVFCSISSGGIFWMPSRPLAEGIIFKTFLRCPQNITHGQLVLLTHLRQIFKTSEKFFRIIYAMIASTN